MSGIEKVGSSIKEKLSLNDYKPERHNSVVQEKIEKVKVSFYIPKEVLQMFNRLYADKLVSGDKVDRSTLISQMIRQCCEGNNA